MITLPQMKAARALLEWTQRDLAAASGLSLAAIAQIESGAGNPRATTMRVLEQTFEKYDIEFSDAPGVRVRNEPFTVTVWQGREAILKVWKDIELTFADGKGGEVLLASLDDAFWEKLYPVELPAMLVRRKKLSIVTRALISAAKDNRGMPTENCRIVPCDVFAADAPYYVYQNKVAIMKARDPIRIVLVNNPTLANSFRAQFQFHWRNGKKS